MECNQVGITSLQVDLWVSLNMLCFIIFQASWRSHYPCLACWSLLPRQCGNFVENTAYILQCLADSCYEASLLSIGYHLYRWIETIACLLRLPRMPTWARSGIADSLYIPGIGTEWRISFSLFSTQLSDNRWVLSGLQVQTSTSVCSTVKWERAKYISSHECHHG